MTTREEKIFVSFSPPVPFFIFTSVLYFSPVLQLLIQQSFSPRIFFVFSVLKCLWVCSKFTSHSVPWVLLFVIVRRLSSVGSWFSLLNCQKQKGYIVLRTLYERDLNCLLSIFPIELNGWSFLFLCVSTFHRRTYSQRRQHQAARKIQQFMRQSKNKWVVPVVSLSFSSRNTRPLRFLSSFLLRSCSLSLFFTIAGPSNRSTGNPPIFIPHRPSAICMLMGR